MDDRAGQGDDDVSSDVFVAIPWRDRGDAARTRAMMHVTYALAAMTGEDVHHVDGSEDRFSLAAARNEAVRQGRAAGAKVIVLCDADTIPEPGPLATSIKLAQETAGIVLPFTLFRALGEYDSIAVMNGRDPWSFSDIGSLDWSVGGVHVTTPEVWASLGEQDERFTGWGCEDTAFAIAADRLGRSHTRVEGTIHHLWHPASPDKDEASEAYIANSALLQRYANSDDIKDIIKEWRRA
jgi:hypothetical protein